MVTFIDEWRRKFPSCMVVKTLTMVNAFRRFLSQLGGGPGVVVSTAAFHARVRGFGSRSRRFERNKKCFFPIHVWIVSIVGSLRDREVACSASDRQGSNFESCVWRAVSFQSSYHPQEVLLAQFSLYVHKGGLKPDSFHFLVNSQPILTFYSHYFPFTSWLPWKFREVRPFEM